MLTMSNKVRVINNTCMCPEKNYDQNDIQKNNNNSAQIKETKNVINMNAETNCKSKFQTYY